MIFPLLKNHQFLSLFCFFSTSSFSNLLHIIKFHWAGDPPRCHLIRLSPSKPLSNLHSLCVFHLHLIPQPLTTHPPISVITALSKVTCCCCSVTQSCLTLCDPMDCSTPGPCPSPSPKVCLSSCPLHQWCYPAISPSDSLFSFCPQSLPASGTLPMSWLFASGDQNTGASASASVLPMSIPGWFSSRLTGLISLLAKGLSGVFSSTTVWRHQFFGALPSLLSSSYHHVWLLGRPEPWLYGLLSAE